MPVILRTNDELRPRRTAFATAALLTAIALLIGLTAGVLFGWPEPIQLGSHYLFTPSCRPPKVILGGKTILWSRKAGAAWVYFYDGTPVFQLGSLKLVRQSFSVKVRMYPPDDPVEILRLQTPPNAGRRLTSISFTPSPPASAR